MAPAMAGVLALIGLLSPLVFPAGLARAAVTASAGQDTFWYNARTGESRAHPPFATKFHDDDTQRDFWRLPNGESTWETPDEVAWYKTPSEDPEHNGREYYVNSKTSEVTWEEPEMFQWKELKRSSKFYHNTITGETVRERPEEMGFVDEETGRRYWRDQQTGEATWHSTFWWTEVPVMDEHGRPDAEGHVYWVNEMTKESTWEKPAVMGWQEWNDPVDHGEL